MKDLITTLLDLATVILFAAGAGVSVGVAFGLGSGLLIAALVLGTASAGIEYRGSRAKKRRRS